MDWVKGEGLRVSSSLCLGDWVKGECGDCMLTADCVGWIG